MSLNNKYTWHDFLKEHPEHREKNTKRTSSEGKKAFESAYKVHLKKYLDNAIKKAERLIERSGKDRSDLEAKLKIVRAGKNKIKIKRLIAQIGRKNAAIARHSDMIGRIKGKQKNLK